MSIPMEKFKHNTVGKFHNIKLMVENLESGKISPREGYGAIHEAMITMINTSRDQYHYYSDEVLVIVNSEEDVVRLIGEERYSRLRMIVICDQILYKDTTPEGRNYYWFTDRSSEKFIFWTGQIVGQLPIRKILTGFIPTELHTIFNVDKITVDTYFKPEESQRLRG